MLSTDEFAAWSKNVVLYLHNTSRVDDEPYPDLLRQKGGRAYPTVSFLDADGELVTQVGHVTPLEQLETALDRLRQWRRLTAAVAAGGGDQAKDLFVVELELGMLQFDEASERHRAFTFDADELATVTQRLTNLEVRSLLQPGTDAAVAGARFVALYRDARIPDSRDERAFWSATFASAVANKDTALFAELLEDLEGRKRDDPTMARTLERWTQQLEQLRADADASPAPASAATRGSTKTP
ncbi:MAG: hypothetical protein AAF628_24650 [Planctomycetota bacterium]